MDFRRFTILDNKGNWFTFRMDMDTIDDDEPYTILENYNKESDDSFLFFMNKYEDDDLVLQILWDIKDKEDGYIFEREHFLIRVGE